MLNLAKCPQWDRVVQQQHLHSVDQMSAHRKWLGLAKKKAKIVPQKFNVLGRTEAKNGKYCIKYWQKEAHQSAGILKEIHNTHVSPQNAVKGISVVFPVFKTKFYIQKQSVKFFIVFALCIECI